MSKAYRCDNCGIVYERDCLVSINPSGIVVYGKCELSVTTAVGIKQPQGHADLCPKCYYESILLFLERYIKPKVDQQIRDMENEQKQKQLDALQLQKVEVIAK